jgi:hypothetical protein
MRAWRCGEGCGGREGKEGTERPQRCSSSAAYQQQCSSSSSSSSSTRRDRPWLIDDVAHSVGSDIINKPWPFLHPSGKGLQQQV